MIFGTLIQIFLFGKNTLWTLNQTQCDSEGGSVGLFIQFGWQTLGNLG